MIRRSVQAMLALLLLLFSVWSLLLPTSFPISTAAVLNARISIARAPIEGEVRMLSHGIGDKVRANELLAYIRNDKSDLLQHITELQNRRANFVTKKKALSAELAETRKRFEKQQARQKEYVWRQSRESEMLLLQARQKLDSLKETLNFKETYRDRIRVAYAKGLIGDTEMAKVEEAYSVAEKSVLMQESVVNRFIYQLDNVRNFFFVGSGIVTPDDSVKIDEVDKEVKDVEFKIAEVSGYLEDIDEQIASDREVLAKLNESSVYSPVTGVIWKLPGAVGQYVDAGYELYRIADESTVHVEAFVHTKYMGQVSVGDKALVYLPAAGRQITGSVRLVQIADDRSGRNSYAVNLSPPDHHHLRAIVQLDPKERNAENIGQLGKVLFVGRETNRLERTLFQLYLNVER